MSKVFVIRLVAFEFVLNTMLPGMANADALSFAGTLNSPNDVAIYHFNVTSPSTYTLQSFSYAGGVNAQGAAISRGGFDPIVSVFDPAGMKISANDDGSPITDPVTGRAFDFFDTLTATSVGQYTIGVTAYSNFAVGPNLSNGFQGTGSFVDVTGNQRTNAYAFDVTGTFVSASAPLTINTTGGDIAPGVFSLGSSAAQASTVQFDGGTLRLIGGSFANNVVPAPVVISTNNGTVDTSTGSGGFSGTVSGPGSLTIEGGQSFSLTGANTYSGGTFLNASTLAAGSDTALGTGALTFNGGTLQAAAGGLTIANTAVLAANGTIDTQAYNLTYAGTISGAGGLTKIGSGTLSLSAANDSLGSTTVVAGTLQVLAGAAVTSSLFDNMGVLSVKAGGSYTVNGNLQNESVGQVIVAAGGSLTDDLVNAGTVTNAGTYNATVASNTGRIGNTGRWNGDVVSNAYEIGNGPTGIWTGNVLANTGTIVNAGLWQGNITNSAGGKLATAGVITGGLTNNGGTVVSYGGIVAGETTVGGTIGGPVVNAGDAAMFVAEGPQVVDAGMFDPALMGQSAQTSGFTTVTGAFNNTGTLSVQNGATLRIGGTLTNGGTINLASGPQVNTLSANSYVGQAGSRAIVGVDLSPAGTSATAGRASQLNFGTASGLTTIAFQNVSSQGQIGYFPRIQVVNVASGGTGAFVADQTSLAGLSNGLMAYRYDDGALIGTMNPSVAAAAGVQTTTVLTTLNSNFFQDWQPFEREAFITAPQDPAPNTIEGGLWIRGKVGHESDDANSTAGDTVSRNRVSTDFTGFQLGGDIGRFNIDGSGWNVIGGITGGEFFANSAEKLGGTTKGNFEIPYVGAYAALTKGPFFVDVLYHHDFYGLKLNDASAGLSDQRLSGNGDSVHLESAYTIALGNYGAFGNLSVAPTGSLIFSRVDLDNLSFSALNLGTVKFDPIDSILGRAGIKVASSFVTEKLALQPFVIASVWHEFEGRTTSEFDSTTGFVVPMSVSRVGTFGQVGLGLNGELIGKNLLGSIRTDFRFGERTSGESLTAQVRYTF